MSVSPLDGWGTMLVTECLDVGLAVSAPFEHAEPDGQWLRAIEAGVLPVALIELYESTKFLSASRLAGFNTPSQRVVSAYIGRTLRSMVECFMEATELIPILREQLASAYTPMKKARGQEWDSTAGRKARSTFRLALIDIFGVLDGLAESIALFLPAEISGLRVGKGMFAPLHNWVKAPLAPPPLIVSPARVDVEELHRRLQTCLVEREDMRAWLTLIRMYRNKVTHLGHQSWQEVGLQGEDGEIYYFVPRTWPFVLEEHAGTRGDEGALARYLEQSLVHVEMHELLEQSLRRARAVAEEVFEMLHRTYRALGVRGVDEIVAQLNSSIESSDFTGVSPSV